MLDDPATLEAEHVEECPVAADASVRLRDDEVAVFKDPDHRQVVTRIEIGDVARETFGAVSVGWQFTFTLAAYNLIRLPKLLAVGA